MRALVFDNKQASVFHLRDEIRIEFTRRCGQPERSRIPRHVAYPVFEPRQAIYNLGALLLLASGLAVKSRNLVGTQEMFARLPLSAIEAMVPVHTILERKNVVERNLCFRSGRKKVLLVNVIALLPANFVDFVANLSGQNEFTTHQRGYVQLAGIQQVGREVRQPLQQFVLANVGLAHLPVQPLDKPLLRPIFHVNVQSQLLLLSGELVGHALAVKINLKTASGLTDCKLVLL